MVARPRAGRAGPGAEVFPDGIVESPAGIESGKREFGRTFPVPPAIPGEGGRRRERRDEVVEDPGRGPARMRGLQRTPLDLRAAHLSEPAPRQATTISTRVARTGVSSSCPNCTRKTRAVPAASVRLRLRLTLSKCSGSHRVVALPKPRSADLLPRAAGGGDIAPAQRVIGFAGIHPDAPPRGGIPGPQLGDPRPGEVGGAPLIEDPAVRQKLERRTVERHYGGAGRGSARGACRTTGRGGCPEGLARQSAECRPPSPLPTLRTLRGAAPGRHGPSARCGGRMR